LFFNKTFTVRKTQVRAVMADPSCSGSGIVRSLERLQEYSEGSSTSEVTLEQQARLQQLSNFQLSVLRKAASFPAVELIVYSTCSIHAEENEGVVHRFLSEHGRAFELADALPVCAKARRRLCIDRSKALIQLPRFVLRVRSGIGAVMRTKG
jgi:putative methyltransferase